MTALILGTILTLAALALVLHPLFVERGGARPASGTLPKREEDSQAERALAGLREIEFDRATGKLTAADYEELKAAYTREAVAAMRAAEGGAPASPGSPESWAESLADAEVEAVISRYRTTKRATSCPACGPRPESDATYCSECGRFLAGACSRCGAAVLEEGARFCTACGATLVHGGGVTLLRSGFQGI